MVKAVLTVRSCRIGRAAFLSGVLQGDFEPPALLFLKALIIEIGFLFLFRDCLCKFGEKFFLFSPYAAC